MSDRVPGQLLQRLRRAAEPADAELLRRFVAGRDADAFAALVGRHGPMVLGVCRRVLRHPHDAEDACQATFLVLARRAAAVRRPGSVGCWLHGVALRVARRLAADAARRRAVEAPAPPDVPPAAVEVTWREVQAVLDEELARLPERYRQPLVLCYLEGRTQAEAARLLGWGPGTFRGRLDRGRMRLRDRLTRRGLGLPAVLLAGISIPPARPASAAATYLAEGVIQDMTRTKVRAALFAVVALIAAGVSGHAALTARTAQDRPATAAAMPPTPPVPGTDDRDRLQGVWQVLRLEAEGDRASLTRLLGPQAAGLQLVFEDDCWAFRADLARLSALLPRPAGDMQVRVQEAKTGQFLIGVGVNSNAGLIGSIVVNERNFDLTRSPAGLDDVASGRAFRGDGPGFRGQAVPGTSGGGPTNRAGEPTFFLDDTRQPRRIILQSLYRGHWRGIYRFDRDELTLCLNLKSHEPPADFAAPKGSGALLLVLKRPAPDRPADPSPERVEALVRQVKEERERLAGTWVVDRPDRNSPLRQGPPVNTVKTFDRLRITADEITYLYDGKDWSTRHAYRIDPTTPVKAIDVLSDPSIVVRLPGAMLIGQRGIYKLEGDTLTLCLAPVSLPRPRDFASDEWGSVWYVRLKRQPAEQH
jgi:RNA polymerase sigma factor (sigma-70 family)